MKNQEKMGLAALTSLVTGNLVGSGVYLLPASLAALGSISLGGWIATSVGALFLALVFAELSSHTRLSGGPYQFARIAFGDTVGYFVCWSYWMLSWISNPALAIAAVGALAVIWGPFSPMETFLFEFIIVISLTLFNLLGVAITGRFEFWITIIKVLPLIILPIIGLFYFEWSNLPPLNLTSLSWEKALSSSALLTMWAFIGLETGTVPAGQVENPEKTVPRATILGTIIAAAIYILGTAVIFGVVPADLLTYSTAPYAKAAEHMFGGNWSIPVAITIVITCLGALNGWIMVVARIPYGAAKDGLFPSIFMKTNKAGTPYWGVLISATCSIPLLMMTFDASLLEQFRTLVDVAVTQILLVYAVCIGSYFVTLHRAKKIRPKHIMIGGVALIYVAWALSSIEMMMMIYSCAIILCGIPMRALFLYKRRQFSLKHPIDA